MNKIPKKKIHDEQSFALNLNPSISTQDDAKSESRTASPLAGSLEENTAPEIKPQSLNEEFKMEIFASEIKHINPENKEAVPPLHNIEELGRHPSVSKEFPDISPRRFGKQNATRSPNYSRAPSIEYYDSRSPSVISGKGKPGYTSFDRSERPRTKSHKDLLEKLISEPSSYTSLISTVIDEKSLSYQIDKRLDEFVKDLPQELDWDELKETFKTKFMEIDDITVKKVERFLRKLKKMIHNFNEIAFNIMNKKIEINFVEIPVMTTAKDIASSEGSIMNFVRDMAWAPLTYFGLNIFNKYEPTNFLFETITQFVISMTVMAIGATLYFIIKDRFTPTEEGKEPDPVWLIFCRTFFIWAGAGLAIPGWNGLQKIGLHIGDQLNLSPHSAGFFSSMFPGIVEGPIQGIMSIISAHTLGKCWNKFRARTFFKQLLIFGTFGAVPGDIWQVAYQAICDFMDLYGEMSVEASLLVLGFGLATAVYIGNVMFGTAYERLINKTHLIIELEAIDENLHLSNDIIEENHDYLVSYNGRPGAPSRASIVIVKHSERRASHSRISNLPKFSNISRFSKLSKLSEIKE